MTAIKRWTGSAWEVVAGSPDPALSKFAATYGDAAATSFTVTHNLGTLDVHVLVYGPSTGYTVSSVTLTSINVVTVVFATAPPLNSVRVVVTK